MIFPADKIEPLTEKRLEIFFRRQDRRDQPPARIWCGDCGSVAVKNGDSWFAIHHADYCLLTAIRTLQADLAHAVGCAGRLYPTTSGTQMFPESDWESCPRCQRIKANLDQKPAKEAG